MSILEPLDAPPSRKAPAKLDWQSRMVLLLVLPAAVVWLVVLLLRMLSAGAAHQAAAGVAAGAVLAMLVWRARAATPGGAFTGGLLLGCFCLTTPGWHSSGWAVLTMLVLTLAATRAGRARKEQLGTAESKHGRGAAQVAANLGVAALAGTLIYADGQIYALTVMLAALAEAGADTLASELGQTFDSTPRLITTFERVPAGTDGGVTLTGTAVGAVGASVVAAAGALILSLPRPVAWIATAAGVAGLLFDSLLGATLERAGWLKNDAVNFLSTAFAGAVALAAAALWLR